jgi:hypothetical protein
MLRVPHPAVTRAPAGPHGRRGRFRHRAATLGPAQYNRSETRLRARTRISPATSRALLRADLVHGAARMPTATGTRPQSCRSRATQVCAENEGTDPLSRTAGFSAAGAAIANSRVGSRRTAERSMAPHSSSETRDLALAQRAAGSDDVAPRGTALHPPGNSAVNRQISARTRRQGRPGGPERPGTSPPPCLSAGSDPSWSSRSVANNVMSRARIPTLRWPQQ